MPISDVVFMLISDKEIFDALMAGKAVRRAGWESMPHRPYFVKMKPYRNMLMLYDDEGVAYHPELADLVAEDWEVV